MAYRRFTPWPAYVDLFGALGVVSIVGWMVASGSFEALRRENEEFRASQRQMSTAQAQAEDLVARFKSHEKYGTVAVDLCHRGELDAACFDVQLEFDLNSDRIRRAADRALLASLARELRVWLDRNPSARRSLQIVIEGHTDSTQPRNVREGRTRFKYNWDLSARRASSVMYELHQAGLNKERYNLIAWGRADTDPRCEQDTSRCLEQNRRTTIKVRFDYAKKGA